MKFWDLFAHFSDYTSLTASKIIDTPHQLRLKLFGFGLHFIQDMQNGLANPKLNQDQAIFLVSYQKIIESPKASLSKLRSIAEYQIDYNFQSVLCPWVIENLLSHFLRVNGKVAKCLHALLLQIKQ